MIFCTAFHVLGAGQREKAALKERTKPKKGLSVFCFKQMSICLLLMSVNGCLFVHRPRDGPKCMRVGMLSKSTESSMNFLWTWAVLIFMIIIITLKQNNIKPWVRNATAPVNLAFSPCHISEVAN